MNLYVYESGPAEAPAILFLHGSPLSGAMWRPQMAGLRTFHCLAPDLPEHGRSAEVVPFEMGETVRWLADLIRTKTPRGRAHVVGLSFGGVVAQALMVHAPEVVGHVVLSGTSARLGFWLRALFHLYLALNRPFLTWLPPEQLAGLLRFQFSIPSSFEGMVARDLAAVSADRMIRFLRASYTQIETPAQVDEPVLVTVGQRETPFVRVMARQLVAEMDSAQGVLVPGVGHVWNLEAPDLFCDVVAAWVMDRALPEGLRGL